jgi:hypothetical protein
MIPPIRLLLAAGLVLLAAGCTTTLDPRSEDFGPVYKPANIHGPTQWPASVRRVAVLTAHDTSGLLQSEFVSTYDVSWRRSLDRSQRAEFIGVSPVSMTTWTGHASLASAGLIPAGFLERVARETGAQAVLFIDLNHIKPYPPLALGFRARLVDPATGTTIWMADELFDAGNADVARAARRYAREQGSGVGDFAHGILQSPAHFSEYAFQAVASLLPPRTPANSSGTEENNTKKISHRADTVQ